MHTTTPTLTRTGSGTRSHSKDDHEAPRSATDGHCGISAETTLTIGLHDSRTVGKRWFTGPAGELTLIMIILAGRAARMISTTQGGQAGGGSQ
jgi:hypothetical protein